MRFDRLLAAAVVTAIVAAAGVGALAQTAEQAGAGDAADIEIANVPACAVSTSNTSFPSYIEDAMPQLKEAVPALRGLRVEEQSPAESEQLLNRTGTTITAMLPRVPNLIAKEEMSQASLALPYMVSNGSQTSTSGYSLGRMGRGGPVPTGVSQPAMRAADNKEVGARLQTLLSEPKNSVQFSYRIQSNPDDASKVGLREFRMNAQNEAIVTASTNPGSPRGVGFGSLWLMFEPTRLNQFQFRHLGREKLGKHDTVVLAFAQIPERATVSPRISLNRTTCSYLMQGVVWIDPTLFQILRLQTDLLFPLTGIHERKLRSEIDFGEIRIPARNLTLWMPSRVEISWEMDTQAGAELHKYSEYRLFGSTSRILIPDEN
jgi:hypothetical protein